ncbi:hypothetical protein CY35_01G040000 [Sphagnum magellanicum]|nr:hypothetical protein CY35_01G040000 [Sphagnum magellanicum]
MFENMSWGGGQFDFTDLEVLTEHLSILAAFAVSATALFLIIENSGKQWSSSRSALESVLPPNLCEGTKATLVKIGPASHSTKGGGISTPPLDLTAEFEAHGTRSFENSECVSQEGSMAVEEDEIIRLSPLPALRSVGVYNEPIGLCLPSISRSAGISNECIRVCPPDNLRSVGVSTEFVESPYSSPALSNLHTLPLSTGCMGDNAIAGGGLQTTEMGGAPQMITKLDSGNMSSKSQESKLRWQKIPPPAYDYLEMIGCTTSGGTTIHVGMSGPSKVSSQPSQGSCQQAPQLTTTRWQNEGDVSDSRSRERKHRWLASNTLDQELDENQICRQEESASRASPHHPLATYPVEHLILQSQAAKNTITGSRDRVYLAAQSSLRNFRKEFNF